MVNCRDCGPSVKHALSERFPNGRLPYAVKQRLDALNSIPGFALQEMDHEITHMDALIDTLRRRRASISRKRNESALISRLPVEIMSEIFLFALAASYPRSPILFVDPEATTLPLILGRVCYAWRNIAWNTSELWANFHLRFAKKRCSTQAILLTEWLARSDQRLLSIHLSMEDEEVWLDPSISVDIIKVVIPHIHKCRSINFIIPECWYELLGEIKGKLNNLTSLTIRPFDFVFVLETADMFLDAPNLRDVVLSHYYLDSIDLAWTQLTDLTLETASTDEALEVLKRCPNLTFCRFGDLNPVEDHYSLPSEPIVHLKLEFFDISLDMDALLTPFLSLVTFPRLRKLVLLLSEDYSDPIIPPIEAFLIRSLCPVFIRLTGPTLEDQQMIDLLVHNKTLRTIDNKNPPA